MAWSTHEDKVSKLTATIKKLKMEGHDNNSVAELEKKRARLLREEVLSRHRQLKMLNALKYSRGSNEL